MTRPFVVVGESLVDIVVPVEGETSHAVGGSPMNVAVGLARLEVPTLLITQIGDDEHGRWVAEHVQASGAQLSPTSLRPGTTTSTATAHLDAHSAASYEFQLTWALERHELPDTVGLHVGSLGASLHPGRDSVLDLVRQADDDEVFVSFDPNIRPAFLEDLPTAWREMAELAALSRLVKVSNEDLQALRPDEPEGDLVAELLAGEETELVIVTRGPDGASAFAEGLAVDVEAPRVTVVDTVGAGDSFMAGTLAILAGWELHTAGPGSLSALDDQRLRTLLEGAMAAAAVTCSRRGANPPTRRELPAGWPAS